MAMHQKVESLTKSEKKIVKKNPKKIIKTNGIFLTWALAVFPRPPLLLVPTESPLDHGSG
jgi:hypothetical protein